MLVTGAGGFIGSHLVERLLAQGHEVRAFIRYTSRGSSGFLAGATGGAAEVVAGDLRDPEAVRGALKAMDAVIHLGALIGIPYSYVHPVETAQTNVLGTLNILTAARDLGTGLVVHTSSSEVYGSARTVPIGEDHPLTAQSPYAASKIAADKLVESFWLSYQLPSVTIRPFNTYGPRQSPRAVIPTIVGQALWGSEIRLGNLHPTRDFTYVADTVDAFVRALVTPAAIGRTVNLGTSTEISIGDLARQVCAVLGVERRVVLDHQRVRRQGSEVERLVSDNRMAKALLEWAPRTDLKTGLTATVEWLRNHRDQLDPAIYAF